MAVIKNFALWVILLLTLPTPELWAGGSGLNVVIVVNQNSTNSVQLGNYYRQQRQVPPQNFLRINWTGGNITWTPTDFTNTLLNPLLSMVSSRHLTNQIDYVVLSMDIPYSINGGANGYNSTTSDLFYGFKNDPNFNTTCEITSGSTNLYAGSEGIFRATPPVATGSNFFLATMITSSNLALAKQIVDQGVASDGTLPSQTVWLAKGTDPDRNVRYIEYDNTVFNTRLRGNYSVQRTNSVSSPFDFVNALGYQNGSYGFGIRKNTYVPGAMADNLTSFGGQLFVEPAADGQTTLLSFLWAGASGSYGTVIEPCNFLDKFPDSQKYFYQARGFNLGECYYQSVTNPYQGLVVGEPLAAPFAQPASGSWLGLGSNEVLSGATNLSVKFTASDELHPVQRVDLFVNGLWAQTVTNIAPRQGDVLNVTLNGFAASYTVPANATIKSVTTGLTAALNATTYQNNTKVAAYAHGDRIELHSIAPYTKTGPQISISVNSQHPSGTLTTFIHVADASPGTFLDTVAAGLQSYQITGNIVLTGQLTLSVTKTNNTVVTASTTNTNGGTIGQLVQQFITAINNTAALQGVDGVTAGDFQMSADGSLALFHLQANSPGFAAAQTTATVTASLGLTIAPAGANTLTDNIEDLRPRNHLYISAGAASLTAAMSFNSTSQADGYHELAAVAYEGTHVFTQARATQSIIIKNTSLTATLTPLLTGSSSSPQPTLQFTVKANENNISSIQLFSTGGLLAAATNQSSAVFSLAFTNLGIGLHPFYALVADSNGHQYQTATQNIGLIGVNYAGASLIGVDYPFHVTVGASPPTLVWPATAGRSYEIQSTANLTSPFQNRATVVPSSSLGQWTETNTIAAQQFYRVSVAP